MKNQKKYLIMGMHDIKNEKKMKKKVFYRFVID